MCTFFLIILTPQAYWTTARGLKIDLQANIRGENKSGVSNISISNLTDIEIIDSAHNNTIEEDVEYTLLSNDDVSFADTDTDDEDTKETSFEEKDEKNTHKEEQKLNELLVTKNVRLKYNWSRNPTPKNTAYAPKNNHLKMDFVVEELRTQLSQEALIIVGSEPNSTTQNTTTGLCVALRNKHGYVKKFVFHDLGNVLPKRMREKAHELGYDAIKAEPAHTEGQLIQFLLRRHQVRPGWYTHIMGMGCSKCHCAECDVLFKLFLREGYHAVTTLVNEKKSGVNDTVVISITNETRDPGEAGAD